VEADFAESAHRRLGQPFFSAVFGTGELGVT